MTQVNRADTPEPPRATATGEGGMPLAHELGGDLPCIRCRYNLRGLSIRAVCPECGTPMRATLLAVVDPLADEFKPIRRPALTALGLITWALAALASCLAAWLVKGTEIFPFVRDSFGDAVGLRWAVPLLAAASGLGALALVRPHDGVSRSNLWQARCGVALYIPVCLLLAYAMLWRSGAPAAGFANAPGGAAAVTGIALCSLLMLILVLLRPNARLLASRSLLMRSGRVDRQTMRTVAAVLCFCMVGYACGIAADQNGHSLFDLLRSIGGLLLVVGWSLFLLGLIGIAYDCWLLYPVIAEPPLSMTNLLSDERRKQAPRVSRIWSHKP